MSKYFRLINRVGGGVVASKMLHTWVYMKTYAPLPLLSSLHTSLVVASYLFSFCLIPLSSHALPQTGGLEGDFLSWGAGARALGLGKAYVALATDSSAAYWNPAGLAFAERSEVGALHAILWEGANYDFLGVALPTLSSGTFGWFGSLLSVGGLEGRNDDNDITGTFGVTKFGTGLAYGTELIPELGVGFTMKWLGRWFDGRESGFVTADVGLRWKPQAWAVLGVVVQQAASIRYGGTEDALLPTLRVGLALAPVPELGTIVADLEAPGGFSRPDDLRWRVGVESAPIGPLTARAGLDTWEAAGGVGLAIEGWTVDYSGATHREFGLSHRIALSTQWGESRWAARGAHAREAYQRAVAAYKRAEKAGRSSEEGTAFLQDAASALREVLSYDSTNQAAQRLLNRMTSAR